MAYTFTLLFIRGGSQDRNPSRVILEVGADTEAMEECCLWLASPGLLSLLSYRTQDHQSRDDTTHHGWLITSCNALQLDLMEAFPQLMLLPLS